MSQQNTGMKHNSSSTVQAKPHAEIAGHDQETCLMKGKFG